MGICLAVGVIRHYVSKEDSECWLIKSLFAQVYTYIFLKDFIFLFCCEIGGRYGSLFQAYSKITRLF